MSEPLSFAAVRRQRGIGRLPILIALIVLILLVAAAIGGYFFMAQSSDADTSAKAEQQPPPKPTFVKVHPMTVNLASDARVLYIGLSLNVADQATAELLDSHMPEVRNRMLITLSDQKAEQLTSAQGKREIAETLRKTLRQPYSADGEDVAINDVLFTDFIVQ
ncbi:flagellar basal body-associated protein FliL [Salinisphaera sp. SPP-AMP-43]|uniref:flagellar basal body-associated protein FliL n=1 Tax=Salinisphaera sp. SPP-AMP-43 TaxID=3121288 RepID=UPI003C6E24FC